MADAEEIQQNKNLPIISVPCAKKEIDFITIFGLILSLALIWGAIEIGQSNASFFNAASVAIVILGTLTVTSISYTGEEILGAGNVMSKSMFRHVIKPKQLAKTLLDIASMSKKRGILVLSKFEQELGKNPFLAESLQMAIDGSKPEDIDFLMSQQIEASVERHKRTASMTQRASETAPAMGLIGTLVGLVQMLAELENPETIGPAMAVALLTTFYGAIMGTVVMAPLKVKLEKNSHDEALIKTLIHIATVSIARQDNTRKLEMELNAALPPAEQIKYFD